MPRRSNLGDEAGSASIEFIVVGLVLLVPLLYLVIALGEIQLRALGAEATARYVARIVAETGAADDPRDIIAGTAAEIAAQYGIREDALSVRIRCTPASERCPASGSLVHVSIRTAVSLPLVPEVLGLERIARVNVEAEGVQRVAETTGE